MNLMSGKKLYLGDTMSVEMIRSPFGNLYRDFFQFGSKSWGIKNCFIQAKITWERIFSAKSGDLACIIAEWE